MLIALLKPTCRLAVVAGICFHLTMNTAAGSERTLFNFATATNVPSWQVVNDDVMGGVSSSSFGSNPPGTIIPTPPRQERASL
jgi:hypothetical protein